MKRLMYVLFFVLLTSGMAYAQQAKYVFYFIGDGMGVNQVNGTEMYLAEQEGRIFCCRNSLGYRCKDLQRRHWYGR